MQATSDPPPADWWSDLLPPLDGAPLPPPLKEMLRLIAYDIADPKRLHRVAVICEDFGVRVQRSLFECWLDEPRFRDLWARLNATIDPAADRIAAYTLEADSTARRRASGEGMVLTQRQEVFVF